MATTARTRVVLLHGVGLDHTMWDRVRDLLPPTYDVVTPDLLGHGSRDAAPEGVTLRDLADDVARGLEPDTHLVGFSLGALVAQQLARSSPHLVASLTSVSSVCRRTETERAAVEGRLITAGSDFAGSVRAAVDRWFAGTDVDAVTVKEIEATLAANDVTSYVRCYRVFARADAEIGPELSRIEVPSLAVTGELDPGSTPEMTRRLAAAIPGCRAVVVPGARHMLPVQAPASLTDPLVTFIGGLS